jgi:ATP-dependent 26S proteasome regulatory subunit
MSADPSFAHWQEQNREFLALAVDDLYARIQDEDPADTRAEIALLVDRMEQAPAFLILTEVFGLGAFEQDIVLACLGSELDPRFRVDERPVTVGYVLEALQGANWAAVDAAAPLRNWGIVSVGHAAALPDATLRLAEDVTRFLMGFDPRVEPDAAFTMVPPPPVLVASQIAMGEAIARAVTRTLEVTGQAPAVELHGASDEDRVAIAHASAQALGATVAAGDVRDLPAPGEELDRLLQTWSRRARLTATLLSITGSDASDEDPTIRHRLDRALARIRDPFFLSVGRPTTFEPPRPVIRRAVEGLGADERFEIWQVCADASRRRLRSRRTRGLAAELAALASDFRVSANTMQRVCLEAEAVLEHTTETIDPELLVAVLRQGCARAVRARLDPLVDRVVFESVAEVALPEAEAKQFLELETTIRLAHEVGVHWGIGHGRTTGTTALFAGPSGTGKTHAAYVLARRLGLDLYRANLASVLSKWIGETEKNLDRIFDAAAIGGVILLFDEADALFGKRSEVRDSHDRYANLSTAYLLSRIENASTPTILTTNLKDAIDPAFVRRLHFVIDFPFPADAQRREIWSNIYPEETPVGELAPDRLAVVAATGGTINNIARRGAFMAAAESSEVEMQHLFEASQRELRKLGRDMTPDELEAWR